MVSQRIAVYGSGGFSKRWPEAIRAYGFDAINVNLYDQRQVEKAREYEAFLCQLNQDVPRDIAFGRRILRAIELGGVAVFPNHDTCWHFEDKLSQNMLFTLANCQTPKTYIFFDPISANQFLETAEFPLVFKLRTGAGSLNVQRVESIRRAKKLVRIMFSTGIKSHTVKQGIGRVYTKIKDKRSLNWPTRDSVLKNLRRFYESRFRFVRERDYVIFQELVPSQTFSVRIAVIGDRAFSYKRMNHTDDFRSGYRSERIPLGPEEVPMSALETAFRLSKHFGFQSMGYDFLIQPPLANPTILEMSHTFPATSIDNCLGYYKSNFEWVGGSFCPAKLILEDLMCTLSNK